MLICSLFCFRMPFDKYCSCNPNAQETRKLTRIDEVLREGSAQPSISPYQKAKGHEEKEFEAEIIYYLRLYNELKGREGVVKVLTSIEEEINNLVEILKEF